MNSFRDLGLDRPIERRDFLNGIALAVAGAALASATPVGEENEATYPPLRHGLRGQYFEAVAAFPDIAAGRYANAAVDVHEEYDLVIVGGGISGLAAAYFYRGALGPEARILILDNHDDFGGHAKRNEFHHQGRTYMSFGGTMGIATPYPYSYAAKSLIRELGVEVERSNEFTNRVLETKYGLRAGMFFDKEHFLEDRLVTGNPRLRTFFEKVPVSEEARVDLIRLHGKNPDYLTGLTSEEKLVKLSAISYQDYLLHHAHVCREAIAFFMGSGGRNNKRVDTTPALESARAGSPGFNGLGLKLEEAFNEGSYVFHFPDGNASIARLLVSRLIPAAIPGTQTMNTIVQAPVAYGELDKEGSAMRIRLSSTAVRVQHDGDPEHSKSVRVAYLQEGKLRAVSAKYCVLACYNAVIPGLIPELSAAQKEALAYPAKVPMLYTSVLLRRWTAFAKLNVARINAPGMYHTGVNLDPGSTIGGYQGVTIPEEPIMLHMVRNPNKPGLPRKEQNRAGQQELLSMRFQDFEIRIREQLARMLAAGGFDPVEDILAIAVNRWPYGYAYTYDSLADPDVAPEQRPHVIGRRRFGRVTIANADAGAAAFTNQAIDEAHRAVSELLVYQGLT